MSIGNPGLDMRNESVGVITGAVIGAGMRVHSRLGSGFQEVVYQRALEIELLKLGMGYEREKSMEILYEGQKIGSRRVDFYIEESVMVELKAVEKLEPIHLAQAKNYLEAYGEQDGLLLNFGGRSLEFKRLYGRRRKWMSSGTHNHENGIKNLQNPGSDNCRMPSPVLKAPVSPQNPSRTPVQDKKGYVT